MEIFRARGFSLFELLIVLTIVALLASVGAFGMSGFRSGQVLRASRDEAAMLVENARSMAVYSGQPRYLRYDSTNRIFWVETAGGTRVSDNVRIESGITVAGPGQVIFTGTGALSPVTSVNYTFTFTPSGRTLTLTIHPHSGRAEAV